MGSWVCPLCPSATPAPLWRDERWTQESSQRHKKRKAKITPSNTEEDKRSSYVLHVCAMAHVCLHSHTNLYTHEHAHVLYTCTHTCTFFKWKKNWTRGGSLPTQPSLMQVTRPSFYLSSFELPEGVRYWPYPLSGHTHPSACGCLLRWLPSPIPLLPPLLLDFLTSVLSLWSICQTVMSLIPTNP